MRFKPGVKLAAGGEVRAPAAIALMVADQVYREVTGHGVTVTSVMEGRHAERSLHYRGVAVDLRTTAAGIGPEAARKIARLLRERLTEEYDVVIEATHIHVEFDPPSSPRVAAPAFAKPAPSSAEALRSAGASAGEGRSADKPHEAGSGPRKREQAT